MVLGVPKLKQFRVTGATGGATYSKVLKYWDT